MSYRFERLSLFQQLDAGFKFDRYVELLENYVKRSTKNKPLILEHGCYNMAYGHHKVTDTTIYEGRSLFIYDDTNKRPFFTISELDIANKEIKWYHDKYNSLFIWRV